MTLDLQADIRESGLFPRTHQGVMTANALWREGYHTIAALVEVTADEVTDVRNVGEGGLRVVQEALARHGLALRDAGGPARPLLEADIRDLKPGKGAGTRAVHALARAGVWTVGDLVKLTAAEVLDVPQCGTGGLRVVRQALARHGLALRGDGNWPALLWADIRDLKVTGGAGTRAVNALRRCKIETVGDLMALTPRQVLETRQVGQRGLSAIREALARHGLALKGEG
jgi:DNA-directed RNA polymerase alpha subunit